jgi:hypothetical protein
MCKSGRLDAMAEALCNSASPPILHILSEVNNPGLAAKAKEVIHPVKTDDPDEVAKIVRKINPDFVLIGPEEPLAAGVVDELNSRPGSQTRQRRRHRPEHRWHGIVFVRGSFAPIPYSRPCSSGG